MATAARERARPLLGTIVRIRVNAGPGADRAIDAAFAEIGQVHARMSFQEPESDLGAIMRATAGKAVHLDERTCECLDLALRWAARSKGVFDPVAAVSAEACWRDMRIEGGAARIDRPLRIDLSGIAKGYAVDRACGVLVSHGIDEAVVEAGGDLRVIGARAEEVALRPSFAAEPAVVALGDGALASSDAALARAQAGAAAHIDGRDRRAAPDQFVAVAAPACADADALTKIVLALGEDARPLLAEAGATAWRHDGVRWSALGDDA